MGGRIGGGVLVVIGVITTINGLGGQSLPGGGGPVYGVLVAIAGVMFLIGGLVIYQLGIANQIADQQDGRAQCPHCGGRLPRREFPDKGVPPGWPLCCHCVRTIVWLDGRPVTPEIAAEVANIRAARAEEAARIAAVARQAEEMRQAQARRDLEDQCLALAERRIIAAPTAASIPPDRLPRVKPVSKPVDPAEAKAAAWLTVEEEADSPWSQQPLPSPPPPRKAKPTSDGKGLR